MSVHASIILRKEVEDLDKADDWFAEVKEVLQAKTTCTMTGHSSNSEDPIELVKES